MKRPFSLSNRSRLALVVAGTGLIAATYGLIRLAFGLFLPDVQAELALDVTAAGLVSGGASVVYCLGAILGFLAAARHPRALVAASAVTGAAGATGMAVAPDAASFAVFAIAASAGAGLASPALVAVLQRNPVTRRSPRTQTIVNAGTGPGLVAAGVLALILLPDWRSAWGVAAAVAVLAAAVVLVSDRAATARADDPAASGSADVDRASDEPAAAGRGTRQGGALPPASWFAAQRRPIAAALLMGFGSAAVWTYGRTFLVESGAGETVSVLAWIALGAGGTAVIATARRLERCGPRAAWALTVCTVAVASASLSGATLGAPLALVACAAFGWGYTAASGALIAWTVEIDAPRAPAGTALLFVTLILGQAIGASVLGALIPVAGLGVVLLAAAAASVLAALPAVPVSRARGAGRGTQTRHPAHAPVREVRN